MLFLTPSDDAMCEFVIVSLSFCVLAVFLKKLTMGFHGV